MRKNVCRALVMLLEVRLDRLLPHMHNIIEVGEASVNTGVKEKNEYMYSKDVRFSVFIYNIFLIVSNSHKRPNPIIMN